MKAVVFIAVVTVLFAAVVTAEPLIMKAKVSHRAYDQNDYSYVFALSKCDPSQSWWGLHGLWPEWGQSCKGPAFDVNQLAPIRSQMDKVWVSCNGDNPAFWKHEWSKHGVCTNMTQLTYFQTGLKLRDRFLSECNQGNYVDCRLCLDMNLNEIQCKDHKK